MNNGHVNYTQHGFLHRRSTTSALLSYTNDLSLALDSNMCVDSAYFDFSKAFDRVRHDYLIQKLIACDISGRLLSWIVDYLSNRTQVVKVKNNLSSERQVTSGVIQGSVLGPLLFNVFINDIDDVVNHCAILKYADDIKIYRCFASDNASQIANSALFQSDIDDLATWTERFDVKFNLSKCCVLHFGKSNIKANYRMNNLNITKKEQEKDLGIVIFSFNIFCFTQICNVLFLSNANFDLFCLPLLC